MSATHRVHVVEASPAAAKLRITIVNDDETGIPLFRTALAAMLFESIDAAEEAGHKVSSAAKTSPTSRSSKTLPRSSPASRSSRSRAAK